MVFERAVGRRVKGSVGYFSNGTEGMIYEERYCAHCIHQDGPEGKTGCAVWLAHLVCNYEECNNKESILHLLIPRDEKGRNGKCLMFVANPER